LGVSIKVPVIPDINERFSDNLPSYFYKSISDIYKRIRKGFRRGVILPTAVFPLHEKIFSLRLKRGIGNLYRYIFEKHNHGQKYKPMIHPPGKELVNGEAALYLGRSYRIEVAKEKILPRVRRHAKSLGVEFKQARIVDSPCR
jgi:hypothetical protein